MIDKWLESALRSPSAFSFDVFDLQEVASAVPVAAELASLLREAYWGEEYLSDLAARYGWDDVGARFLQARVGTMLTVKRGDFGEALAAQFLKEVEQYSIPVAKLRFKIASNQTLPGTDCVAVKLSKGRLVEVCYVESKLRTTLDLAVAVAGVAQLKRDADTTLPEIMTFIARRSNEAGDPIAASIEEYIFSRDIGLDSYKLIVFHEKVLWDERILQNVEDEAIQLKPLSIYVAKIDNIRTLSDNAFSALGVHGVADDDN